MEQARISSSQGTQPAHAARGKPVAQGADTGETGGAAAGGFLALLMALGEGAQEGGAPLEVIDATVDAGSGLPADGDGDSTAAPDVSAIAAWQGVLLASGAVPRDVGAPAQESGSAGTVRTGLPEDGMVIGRHEAGSGPVTGIVTNASTTSASASIVAEEGVSQGLVAETTMLDTSADLKGSPLPGAAPSYGRAFSRLQNALSQRGDGIQASRSPSGQGEAIHLQASHGAALTGQVPGERLAASVHAGGAERGAGALARSPGSDLSAAVESLSGFAESMVRSGPSSGGSRSGEGGSSEAGTWFDGVATDASLEPVSADATAVFADPTQAGAEEQVADRVAYWIHQKTQNAELTLNRDGQPVEVSVSLSGNEAHVSFRSDQAQTRELLDQSMAQLRELLRSEGLVLSGMSVGTSAGNGAGAGNADSQRPRDGARQAQVVSAVPAGSGALLRGGASADRAVDIFV